jgi:hypothetical protein
VDAARFAIAFYAGAGTAGRSSSSACDKTSEKAPTGRITAIATFRAVVGGLAG